MQAGSERKRMPVLLFGADSAETTAPTNVALLHAEDDGSWYCFGRVRPTLRGVIHTAAFWTAPVWGLAMLLQARSVEMCLHAGLSLASKAFLFGASSKYHRHPWKTLQEEKSGARWDFAAIHAMVAFSLSPLYSFALGTLWSSGFVVVAALIGVVACQYSFFGRSRVLRTSFYVLQGVLAAAPLAVAALNSFELACMLVAALGYLVGASCYAFEFPTPSGSSRRHWEYVEFWHLLVLVAAAGLTGHLFAFVFDP
jgi:hemolysin III